MQKQDWKYIGICIFFFIALVFIFTISRGDTYVNYGFSYAISKGEIPYKDFNMVITPFAPFLYSIFLLIKKDILFFYYEQAILLTILYACFEKLLGKKSIILLLLMLIPYPIAMVTTIYPGYNFLILFLVFLFFYHYKNNTNDYLLGILLGLIFCTKQTIGMVLFLPTLLILWKDKKKGLRMILGYLIPIVGLFIYLLLTKSLKDCINLCFLGLLDFGSSNHVISPFYGVLLLMGVSYFIYQIIKDRKNILLYYALFFAVVSIPIVDYYHVSLFLVVVFYFLVDKISFKEKNIPYFIIGIISICIIWSFVTYKALKEVTIKNFPNFTFTINTKQYNDNTKKLYQYTNHLNDPVIYFMRGSENYYYKIMNHQKIDYLDLPNKGNYGYKGTSLIMEKIHNIHQSYFVLDKELLKNDSANQQYIKELGELVEEESILIKEIGLYQIYWKE